MGKVISLHERNRWRSYASVSLHLERIRLHSNDLPLPHDLVMEFYYRRWWFTAHGKLYDPDWHPPYPK